MVVSILGLPVVALLLGTVLAALLIDRKQDKDWPQWISEAIKDAGVIILITGVGGAFGAVIKASGIDHLISGYATGSAIQGSFFLFFAFFIAAVLKTAQGSTTSSMIITSSLCAPLALGAGLTTPVELSLLVMAIGGGAMTVSHANDSYFWVVSQFGGISSKDAFRSFTLVTFLQGLTVLITTIILFQVL